MASDTHHIARNASIILAGMITSKGQARSGMTEEAVRLAREIDILVERPDLAAHGMPRTGLNIPMPHGTVPPPTAAQQLASQFQKDD